MYCEVHGSHRVRHEWVTKHIHICDVLELWKGN